ncbi:hypothetical protein GCM10009584_14290 [Ornithinimicrobium humiphilum]|uniref:DUF3800 domain-containing protein n=1 Tax=Ornithinimicrobium humiphilum TaxID=125288 RepID=A0A543KKB5_9MICO|nr:DUF3800 domain-containing protein [Ornithinimicrobium humiphilum]TQM95522.1 hypothetical protein FB476_0366 [Ornithinimicrobium humiphilum]
MADVFLYADETGNLDYAGAGKHGASAYFGFGTAVFNGDHGDALMEGLRLRAEVTATGVTLPRGFHAVDDSNATRGQMFELIAEQAPRFDTTFLLKAGAYPRVKAEGEMRLYKLAWYLHFKEIALQVSNRGDRLYVIAGTFGTKQRRSQAEAALHDVCRQVNRDIRLCVWEAATSWGLQVADYGLWAAHRDLRGKHCYWYGKCVEPTLQSRFAPWGVEPVTPPLPTS